MENKTLIFVLLLVVANVGFVSSADWDNVYNYNSETKTATIENWFGLGEDLAYVALTSPINVKTPRGIDRLVGEFNFTTTGDFIDTFGDIYLEDVRSGNEISRGKQFKYKKYINISVDDYELVCENIISENGTEIQDCIRAEVGSHWEIKMDWMPINNPTNVFYEGVTYEIGVFVDVEAGDYGDWVPSIMGVEIEEWATWQENLNVGLVAYYKLNGTSGVVLDSTPNGNSGTNNGADRGAVGIINASFDFELSDGDWVNVSDNTGLDNMATMTMNLWINTEGTAVGQLFRKRTTPTAGPDVYILDGSAGNMRCLFSTDGGADIATTTANPPASTWTMVTCQWNGTSVNLYYNSTLVSTTAGGGGDVIDTGGPICIGATNCPTTPSIFYDGRIDEFGIWNRTLNQSELTDLYNNGSGITWRDDFVPETTILFPQNITYNDTVTELNYTVDATGNRCWFSDDGGITNSSDVPAGTNFTGLTSISLQNEWTVFCNNSLGGIGSSTVLFFVNKSATTELISPANDSRFNITLTNFIINSTPTNTNLTNVTLYIWNSTGSIFLTNITILSNDSEVQTSFTENLTDGIFFWNAETCGEDVECLFADNNRTLEIHTIPSTIIIHYPNETIDFLAIGGNLTLNWTISESGQNLSEHIANCSYIYNEVETQLNLTQCLEINETTFLYVAGVNNLTFKTIEEFGLITTNITTWDFLFEKYNVTFNNQTLEGTQETFTAEIILRSGSSISQAIFYYNDTNYTTNIIFSSGEYAIISSITIPLINTDTNFSLGFYIVVGGTTYNLETFEQQVVSINMSLCGASNDTLLNMSLFNEETRVSILGDIEINAQAISKTSGEIIESFNTSFTNISSGRICLSPTEAYNNLYFTTEIRYVSDNFVPEFYHIQLADMADYPRNLSLFDLAINDSTEFSITYQDDSLIPVEGAIIQLQRKYISLDIWEVVEAPLTSNTGSATVHIDLNTNKYRASVVKNGVLLDFFDNIVFDCENELSGECTELLLGTIDPQNNIPLINLTDFSYSISSAGNTITTTFIVPSGTPSNINVVLTQLDQFGNETTCNQSVLSSAGSIDCDFNATIGDSFLSLEISKDAELKAQQTFIVVEDTNLDFLGNNFFIVIIILLSLVGMAITSPEWMIINAVMVMLIGGAFWLLNGMNFVMGLGSLIWLVISAIILIIKLAKQEDR